MSEHEIKRLEDVLPAGSYKTISASLDMPCIETDAEHIVDALGDAVDALEDEIQSRIPEARHVDLEAD